MRLTLIPNAQDSLTILGTPHAVSPWVSTSPATREAGSGSASTQRQHSPGASDDANLFQKEIALRPAGQLGIQQSGHTSKIAHYPGRPTPQFRDPSCRSRLPPLQPAPRPRRCWCRCCACWLAGRYLLHPASNCHKAILVTQPRLGMQIPHGLSSRTACPVEEIPRQALDPCTHSPYLETNRADGAALTATSRATAAIGSVWLAACLRAMTAPT